MDTVKKTANALRRAIEDAGSQVRIVELTGIKQPRINRFFSGKNATQNMKFGTLMSIFPDPKTTFFKDEQPMKTSIIKNCRNNQRTRRRCPA